MADEFPGGFACLLPPACLKAAGGYFHALLRYVAAVACPPVSKKETRLFNTDGQTPQQGIDAERLHLDEQSTVLEDERRAIAAERVRDPIIANALIEVLNLAGCAQPLVLAFLDLHGADKSEPDAALSELLVQELVADKPLLRCRPAVSAVEPQPVRAETVAPAIAEPLD